MRVRCGRPTTPGMRSRPATTGSYYSGEFVYDAQVVSDRNFYRADERRACLTTPPPTAHQNCDATYGMPMLPGLAVI